jgi:hypothetical protein
MKAFRRLTLTFLALLLIFSVLCVGVSAEGEKNDIIQNDKVYTVLPDGYFIVGGFKGITYFDDEYNTISFIVTENKIAPNGIQNADINEIKRSFIAEYLCDDMIKESDVITNFTSSEKQTVNGLKGIVLRGKYAIKSNGENDFWDFCSFVFATKENLFFVNYEQLTGEFNKSDFDYILNNLTVNGTFFDGDKPTITYDFKNAIPFDEALQNANEGLYDQLDPALLKIVTGTLYAISLVPTLIIAIIIIIVAVRYKKNKKQLKQYEALYGGLNMNYNTPYPPINNGYSPYTQGYNPQTGYSPYISNQYAQPPVQPVQPMQPMQPVQNTVENTENKENQ